MVVIFSLSVFSGVKMVIQNIVGVSVIQKRLYVTL